VLALCGLQRLGKAESCDRDPVARSPTPCGGPGRTCSRRPRRGRGAAAAPRAV
jgi:hypothetical protein